MTIHSHSSVTGQSLVILVSCNLQAAGPLSLLLPRSSLGAQSTLSFHNIKPFRAHVREITWWSPICAHLILLDYFQFHLSCHK